MARQPVTNKNISLKTNYECRNDRCRMCQGQGWNIYYSRLDEICPCCEGSGLNTEYRDCPICPHCGAEMDVEKLYEDKNNYCCEDCDNNVNIRVEYIPKYTTNKA